MIPAFLYEKRVYKDFTDWDQDKGEYVQEVHIPSSNILFNSSGQFFLHEKMINKFSLSPFEPRIVAPVSEVHLSQELVERIELIAYQQIEYILKDPQHLQNRAELLQDLEPFWHELRVKKLPELDVIPEEKHPVKKKKSGINLKFMAVPVVGAIFAYIISQEY